MTTLNTFNVCFNSSKNRIFITILGILYKKNIDDYSRAVYDALEQAQEGFTVLLDLTQSTAGTPDVELELEYLRDEVLARKPKGAATVTNSLVMKMYSSRSLEKFAPNDFKSIEDAEHYLDSL